ETVPGTGPGGRVTKQDVQSVAERRESLVAVAEDGGLEVPSQGDGDTVLLLPGFGTDVSAFAPQVPVLADRFRVRGVNPRGVGLSDPHEADATPVAQTAADAAALLDAPAHVVGASLGAAAALELALAAPERVRSLTLITPFLRADARLLAVSDAWCRVAAAADPDTLARMLLPWLFAPATLADAAARDRLARGLAATVSRAPAATLQRMAAGLEAWSGTRVEAVAGLTVPTLVIEASEDLLTPASHEVAEAIPGAKHASIAGAGHAVTIEAADAVNEALLGHLA
ncbi:MAG: alpha/beta fold hydrolase, partial [Proteobacteria bacterium]|nr:alpha/beta fold hydrolase [Pseudomonadota bacterium]